jgi:hypothetical protein
MPAIFMPVTWPCGAMSAFEGDYWTQTNRPAPRIHRLLRLYRVRLNRGGPDTGLGGSVDIMAIGDERREALQNPA